VKPATTTAADVLKAAKKPLTAPRISASLSTGWAAGADLVAVETAFVPPL
jgi:hypothetical protein